MGTLWYACIYIYVALQLKSSAYLLKLVPHAVLFDPLYSKSQSETEVIFCSVLGGGGKWDRTRSPVTQVIFYSFVNFRKIIVNLVSLDVIGSNSTGDGFMVSEICILNSVTERVGT